MGKKILIINNLSGYINQLERVCGRNLKKVVEPGDIDIEQAEKYDVVFLSGGFHHEIMDSDDYYAKEIRLVRRADVPIIGVCLGFQLIAHSYGVPIHRMPRVEHSTLAIHPTELGEEILGTEPLHVYENHRWVVSKTPDDFNALATSKDGIEAIKHTNKPIFGFQFHPEMFVSKTDGRNILRTVLATLS